MLQTVARLKVKFRKDASLRYLQDDIACRTSGLDEGGLQHELDLDTSKVCFTRSAGYPCTALHRASQT